MARASTRRSRPLGPARAPLLVGAVGDDQAAELLLGEAESAGVDTRLVRRATGRSGTAWIMVRPDGENAIVVDSGANADVVALTEAEREAVGSAAVVVVAARDAAHRRHRGCRRRRRGRRHGSCSTPRR